MADAADGTWARRANRVTSRWRTAGGRLRVVDGELGFSPHFFDKAFSAWDWHVPLDEITAIRAAPRRPFSHVFGAGLRRQLCVEARGEEAYFIVNGVDGVVSELRGLASLPDL